MCSAGISKAYQMWVLVRFEAGKKPYHTPAALVASPVRCNLNSVIEKGGCCTKAPLKIGRYEVQTSWHNWEITVGPN